MNKSELCVSIANREGMSQANVEELYGFGKFDIREREERQMYNPQTDSFTTIAHRRSVIFKPGKELKDLRELL